MNQTLKSPLWLVPFVFLLSSCVTTFDEQALKNATDIKAKSDTLIGKGTDPYSLHQSDADALLGEAKAAYEYEKTRKGNNKESIGLWELVIDPETKQLAGVLKKWKDDGALNEGFVPEAKSVVADGFDLIIKVENAKPKE